jgi:hypothetical protein
MFGLLEDAIEEPPDHVHPAVIRPGSADAAVGTGLVAVGRHVTARAVGVVADDAVDDATAIVGTPAAAAATGPMMPEASRVLARVRTTTAWELRLVAWALR